MALDGFQQTGNGFDQRTFSRTIRPDNGRQASLSKGTAQMMDGRMAIISHCDIAERNQRNRLRHFHQSKAQPTANHKPAEIDAATATR
jgi:hypothetical protein